MKEKILWGIAVVALALGGWASIRLVPISVDNGQLGTATGNLLAEQYLPYVLYNQGYNSAKSITTSDTVTGADVAVTDDLTVTDDATITGNLAVTATSTLSDTVNFDNGGICINFYATSTNTRVHITASTTPDLPAGAAGVLTFDYGACAN